MNSNDCSICFEAITAETGQTTLGCGHAYHLRCITGWFYAASTSQQGGDVACPCCRKVVTEEEWSPPSRSQTIHAAAAAVGRIEEQNRWIQRYFMIFMIFCILFALFGNPYRNARYLMWIMPYLTEGAVITCQMAR
jgi:hypothetical protein